MISLSGSLETGKDARLFSGLDISLVDGGWTCLLGPSGVGKTTILRLLAGLETHGDFDGSINSVNCAYMAQQDLLLPWLDVVGNVTLGAKLRGEDADRDRALDLIERVGLSSHTMKFPKQLSGGMRQRVALARTLMEDQKLVLLDEPFSALDARTRAEMQELAHELLAGRTVMLVTHDPSEAARLGDGIFILDETGQKEIGSKKTLGILAAESPEALELQSVLLLELRKRVS